MTVRRLIQRTLRLLNVTAQSEDPDAPEMQDAFETLNDMIASWNREGLMLFRTLRQEFPLTANTASYTIGSGGVYSVERPDRIDRASYMLGSGTSELELPMEILKTALDWSTVVLKNTASSVSLRLYYDPTFPLGTIYVHPIPSVNGTMTLYLWGRLTQFDALTDDIELPDGYARAIRYNLAAEIAPEFAVPLDSIAADVRALAIASKENIKSLNIRPQVMSCDPAATTTVGGTYNWRTDSYTYRR